MTSLDLFDQFWAAYPARDRRKRGKGETWAKWKALPPDDWPLIIQAAAHYAKDEQVMKGYAKDPVRFLRHDYWRDFLEAQAQVCAFRTTPACEALAEPGQEVCAYHAQYRAKLAQVRLRQV